LKPIIKYNRQKIFFETDVHRAHKTKMLKEWLAENKNQIEVFFQPPYSPELNLWEYIVKTNELGKKRPINKTQMRNNVEDFMNGRKND
jgi:transposase